MSRYKKVKDLLSGSLLTRSTKKGEILYYRKAGQTNPVSTGFHYSKENIVFVAQKIEKDHRESLEEEYFQKKRSTTLKKLLKEFFFHKEKIEKRTYATISGYRQFANKFLNENVQISKDKELENYINVVGDQILMLENVSNNTINTYMRNLRVFVNYFVNELEYEIKFKKMKYTPNRTAREPDNYSPEELDSILRYFYDKDYEIYLLLLLTLHTAMRISESLGLYFSDIDFKNKVIELKESKSQDKAVVLTNIAIEVLQALQDLDKKKSENNTLKPKGKVFRWSYASRSFINKQIRKCLKELRIHKKFRNIHTLRKTYSQMLFDENTNEQTIKGGMRHTKIEITNKHYYKKNNDKIIADLNSNEKLKVFTLNKNDNPQTLSR